MKNGFMKKSLSLILSLIFVFTPLISASASGTQNKICPTVVVSGFMSTPIYADPGNYDSEVIWPPASEKITAAVEKCMPAISELALKGNWDSFTDSVIPVATELLSPVFLNEKGELPGKATVRAYDPDINSLNSSNTARFIYDWRVDPYDSAAQLDKFIDKVLAMTGSEKVNIDCHSLGGVIALTYSTLYGNSKINTYIFHSTALYGLTYTGELLNGNIVLSGDSLRCFLNFVLRNPEYQEAVRGIAYMLASAGLLDFVAAAGNKILSRISGRILPEVVAPMFGRWPTIWAMSTDDDVESGLDYIFTEMIEDSEDARILRGKIEKYNKEVRANREKTLKKIDEECRLGVIAKYGYPGLPFTPAWNINSDGTIDVRKTSFGATSSLYEEFLPEDYIAGIAPEYISPDKTIDASTAMFPDRTWYIKDMEHSQMTPNLHVLIRKITDSPEEITVYSDPEFPRFMLCDNINNVMIPDVPEEKTGLPSFWQLFESYWKFIYTIYSKVRDLFRS